MYCVERDIDLHILFFTYFSFFDFIYKEILFYNWTKISICCLKDFVQNYLNTWKLFVQFVNTHEQFLHNVIYSYDSLLPKIYFKLHIKTFVWSYQAKSCNIFFRNHRVSFPYAVRTLAKHENVIFSCLKFIPQINIIFTKQLFTRL